MTIFPAPLSSWERRWLAFGLLATFCLFGFYYGAGWLAGEDTALQVLYRPGQGDRDYLPFARQFAAGNFHEAYTSGLVGRGWVAFPCFSVLPHGLGLRWIGPVGFALMDVVTPGVYFLVAARLLMAAGASSRVALVIALFFTMQGFAVLGEMLIAVFGYALHAVPFYLTFLQSWEFRFPRNFVSEIFVLGALGNWCGLVRAGLERPTSWWVTTAAWLAAVLQSDVYSFIALGLVFAVAFVAHLPRLPRPALPALAKRVGLMLVVGLALATPFILQRAYATWDILERYGVFFLPRSTVGQLGRMAWNFFPHTFTWFALLLPWSVALGLRMLGHQKKPPLAFAAALTALQLAGFAAMPTLIAVTGQAVQLYHFRDAARTLIAWSTIIVIALAATAAMKLLGKNATRRRVYSLVATTAAAGIVVALLWPAQLRAQACRQNTGTPRSIGEVPERVFSSYHADLAALSGELDRAAADGARVLATTDVELYAWWTGLRGRESFLAHIFVSSQDNAVLFGRLAQFARYNQIGPDDFIPWLFAPRPRDINCSWYSGDRYQAGPLHTFAPLSDYNDRERASIAATQDVDCWNLIAPAKERERLANAYREFLNSPPRELAPTPALLVLTREFPKFRPDPALFRLVYENPTFLLFHRR